MSGWGWFFLILLLLVLAYGAFVGWRIFQARKSGEPIPSWKAFVPFMKSGSSTNYPTPRSAGPIEWIKDKIEGLRNKRSRGQGGYEESRGLDAESGGYAGLGGGGGRRGRGLEDDAWDSRVGNEDPYAHGPGGYYEEQELGLATPGVPGQSFNNNNNDYMGQSTEYGGGSTGRGRSQQRESNSKLDPFGDQHEATSLRSISPRPHDLDTSGGHKKGQASLDSTGSGDGNTSPISTRKSVFREGI